MLYSTGSSLIPNLAAFLALLLIPGFLFGHCDTMDGPVIADARKAFETGSVEPVLKWVMPENEKEIGRAFEQAVNVKTVGGEAAQMAEMYFYETLVRIHRAGEGAGYNGLKSPGQDEDPAVERADKALEQGNIQELLADIKSDVERQINTRFERASRAREKMDNSVREGRAYVEAYVDYVHFIKELADKVSGSEAHQH